MEKIYILGNSKTIEEVGGTFIEIPNLINEAEIHHWVVQLFKDNRIDKILIEISSNPLLSIQIGYHIRLSIEDLRENVLIPILFVSLPSLNEVILNTGLYSHLLATKGVYFSEFDLESIEREIPHLVSLHENEYLSKFLKIINIQPDETIGRHSLANIWGAFAMDIASNANALPKDAKFKKELYFKYITAFNNIYKLKPALIKVLGQVTIGGPNKIEVQGKKILLIDDEADKGWEVVLRKVFKTSNPEDFVVIKEKVKDFDSLSEANKLIIEKDNFDVYLIDLRLNGLDEDDNLKTEAFSGMKILQKIKSLNKGNQVIIFTASNKSWNLKSLLDAGADGYYLKESPEYNFSKDFSIQNYNKFKYDVKECINMSYLRIVDTELNKIRGNIKAVFPDNDVTENEVDSYLNIFFELLKETKKDSKYFNYAYIQLFLLIELFITQESIFKDGDNAYVICENSEVLVQKRNAIKVEQAIMFNINNGKYELNRTEYQLKSDIDRPKRLDTNFKVSALLMFRYGHTNSSVKKWTEICGHRNTKIAHYKKDSTSTINIDNILDLINFVEYITNLKNIKSDNKGKGLKEKSMEESMIELKNQPYYKENKKSK
jgi:CheY-like chemotaxis protein